MSYLAFVLRGTQRVQRSEYTVTNHFDTYITMCLPASQTMAFPVVSLVRFWANHHLLDIVQRPVWRVVKGRSREYVKKILAGEARSSAAPNGSMPKSHATARLQIE